MKKELRDSSNSTNYGNGTHTKPYNTSENQDNRAKIYTCLERRTNTNFKWGQYCLGL